MMPSGPLTEAGLRLHVWPLFRRTMARPGVYMANHSLGRPLDAMATDVERFVDSWYRDMDRAWDEWTALRAEFCAAVESLLGARQGTVTQRQSAGQGLRAVLNSFPTGKQVGVVTTAGEFDSVDTVLRAFAEVNRVSVKWVEMGESGVVPSVDPEEVLSRVDDATDLVVVSHVYFGTGAVFPNLRGFIGACHERGALVLLDVYHSAGALPVDIGWLGADFAIGGSYKYLRGGPGAGWLYVSPEVLDSGRTTLDTGWFAKEGTFEYRRDAKLHRKPGIDGWAESTPPVIATYQALSGIDFTLRIGVDRIRSYSLERQAMLRDLLRHHLVPVVEPGDPDGFGAFTLAPSDDGAGVCERAAEHGLTVDSRGPFIRICPDVLNTVADFEICASVLAAVWR